MSALSGIDQALWDISAKVFEPINPLFLEEVVQPIATLINIHLALSMPIF